MLRDRITPDETSERIRASLPDMSGWSEVRRYEFYKQKGISLIKEHPFQFLVQQMRSILQMMLVPGETDLLKYFGVPLLKGGCAGDLIRLRPKDYFRRWVIENPLLFGAFLTALAYLALFYTGVFRSLTELRKVSKESLFVHAFLWGVALYFLPTSAVTDAYPRFRVSIMPILALYSGYGWYRMGSSIKDRFLRKG
jgi:hypothetical protein